MRLLVLVVLVLLLVLLRAPAATGHVDQGVSVAEGRVTVVDCSPFSLF